MTGGGISVARAEDDGQFIGHAEIRGPKWLRMPVRYTFLWHIFMTESILDSHYRPSCTR